MKKFQLIRIIFYIGLFVLFILNTPTKAQSATICPLYNLFHIQCPGCGVTRAFTFIMHGDFITAYSLNAFFTVALFPISVILMFDDFVSFILRVFKRDYAPVIEYLINLIFNTKETSKNV